MTYREMAAADDHGRANRPITSARSFRETVAGAADGPDVDALEECARRVAGPGRRADETPDAYAVRVFAGLSEECAAGRDVRPGRVDWALYAGEAAETGRAEKAARWLWRLVADRPSDAAAWLLYAAFCARRRPADLPSALACARRAVALDGGHRLASFALAAILMTACGDDGGRGGGGCGGREHADELESTLRGLLTAHPRCTRAHHLAAVQSLRAGMPAGHTDRLLTLAHGGRDDHHDYDDDDDDDGDAGRLLAAFSAAWPPVRDGGDAAVGCAALLLRLGLVDLAAVCARSFAASPDERPSYHYLMAVVHHGRGEYEASADHLAAVPDDDADDTR